MSNAFTAEQLDQIKKVVREGVREELADAGLRLDDPTHQDLAREDFRFLRRLRQSWDGATAKVGNAVLIGILTVLATIFGAGFWAWLNSGPK